MTDAGKAFEQELEILRTEAQEAAQHLYAYVAIHATMAQHSEVATLLNTAALFWNTTLRALQTSALIALGRVFDDDKNSHGVTRLLRLALGNQQIFTLDALAVRRQGNSPTRPNGLDEYLSNAYAPVPADFEWLQQKVDEHKAIYDKNYKPLRNKIFAHKDIHSNAMVQKLLARTNIRELQTVTLFLQSVYSALWELYFNGMKLNLREHPPSVEDMLREPIPVGREVPPQEKIAHEAVGFLLTAARGNPNP
jgi:hypothetical protein